MKSRGSGVRAVAIELREELLRPNRECRIEGSYSEAGRLKFSEFSEFREDIEQFEKVLRWGAGFGGTAGGCFFGGASSTISTSKG